MNNWMQARWIGVGIALLVAVGATGGTLAATTSGTTQSAATAQYPSCSFRWHYAPGTSTGGWSGSTSASCVGGSFKTAQQAMDGDLKVAPGTIMRAGFSVTAPGVNTPVTVSTKGTITFTLDCANGAPASPSTFTIPVSGTYQVTGSAWSPSGDQSNSSTYQGSAPVPAACPTGVLVRFDKGGYFTAST
jgi:hypothetical protein